MGSFSGICLELGIGIAIGMLAGTTGTHGSARGRMTILAGVIAIVVGFLLADSADVGSLAGALFCLIGAVFACLIDLPHRGLIRGRAAILGWHVPLDPSHEGWFVSPHEKRPREHGARLPSGSNNVRARYRKGLGAAGNVKPIGSTSKAAGRC